MHRLRSKYIICFFLDSLSNLALCDNSFECNIIKGIKAVFDRKLLAGYDNVFTHTEDNRHGPNYNGCVGLKV